MKKYFEEIVIFIVQLLTFYVFPIFSVAHRETSGIIIIILIATFMLAIGMGAISKRRIKYYYPIAIVFLFIPAVYIYHTEFYVLDCIWLLIDGAVGVLIGDFIMKQ